MTRAAVSGTDVAGSDLPIVDHTTRDAFLSAMTPFRLGPEDLARLVQEVVAPSAAWEDASYAFPALLVDFDARRVVSRYTEPTRFEAYAPEGWCGEWRDFLQEVPAELRYWVVDGVDSPGPADRRRVGMSRVRCAAASSGERIVP